jgi:cytidine deaminase
MKTAELVALARQAQELAYAPYSQYRVGAALLTTGGQIYTGANIENVSYGLTVCAERTAVFKAVLAGERNFQAIALTGSDPGYTNPCGACLQVLAEFSTTIKIITANEKDEIREYYLSEMLPHVFSIDQDDLCSESPGESSEEQVLAFNQNNPSRRGK